MVYGIEVGKLSEFSSSIEQIMEDIDIFLGKRFKKRRRYILKALKSIADPRTDFDTKVEAAGKALQEFWKEYSEEHIAKVLEGFPKIQKALFGLELEPELGERYRDHFLHMFNVFIFGTRILSKIMNVDKDHTILKKLLKVTDEPEEVNRVFQRAYTAPERLNFLWTLMSTFHDVGIPIQHLPNFKKGLNSFLEHFGLRISEFLIEREAALDCKLHYYITLMARIYNNGGITLNTEGEYVKTDRPNPYVYKMLIDEYSKNNHGLISAICLYKSIEETFYKGKKKERRLDIKLDAIPLYNDLIFEQDITRVALSIALHDVSVKAYPKLFPIRFRDFPLLFLLILCDEFQEYFRLEGSSLSGVTLIKSFPFLDVKVDDDKIKVSTKILYKKPNANEERVIRDEVLAYYSKIGEMPPDNFEGHVTKVWKRIIKRLEEKLKFKGEPIKITLEVYSEKKGSTSLVLSWDSESEQWSSNPP